MQTLINLAQNRFFFLVHFSKKPKSLLTFKSKKNIVFSSDGYNVSKKREKENTFILYLPLDESIIVFAEGSRQKSRRGIFCGSLRFWGYGDSHRSLQISLQAFIRRKIMKKILSLLCAASLALSLAACGSSSASGANPGNTGSKGSGATIEYAVNYQIDDQVTVMEEIIAEFEKESGIHVELTLNGADHEAVMKTRMASGDLPDLWNTHGWSVARYKEYLLPLNDQPWFEYIDSSVLGAVADEDGNVYTLPIGEGANGILVNKDVLESVGVDPYSIFNISDFEAAMDKLVAAGITPMYLSNGSSATNNGHFMDAWLAAWLTCSSLPTNYGDALLDGSFDWENARPLFDKMADWWSKGYWNVDAASADRDTCFRAIASGECAFMFYTNDGINACLDVNPDAHIGMIPMPSVTDDGLTTWGISEGNNSCIGIWKDSDNLDACKTFLEYLAKPEVAERILIEIEGGIPGMTNINVDGSYSIDAIREGQKAFEGRVDYGTYFDQAYLPSGMFYNLMETSSAFFEGEGGTEENITNALALISNSYHEMYSAS